MTEQEYKYAAFISYSRRDEAKARMLHRELEATFVPSSMRSLDENGREIARFRPVFLDSAELPASHALRTTLEENLAASKSLVVLCSAAARQSPWVAEEIEIFKRLGRAERIFSVLVDSDRDAGGDELLHFPEGLIVEGKGPPLAADLRNASRVSQRQAAWRLVAGMLGVSYDAIYQRATQERRRLVRRVAAISTVALAIVLFIGAFLLMQREAERTLRLQSQSWLAAESANRIVREDLDTADAVRMTIDALPGDKAGGDRRYVPYAEAALYNSLRGLKLLQVLDGHEKQIMAITASRDEGRIASASADGTARIWSLASAVKPLVLGGHRASVLDVKFLDNDKLLASASVDGTVKIWDTTTGGLVRTLTGHTGFVTRIVPSPDGKRFATISTDGTARLWTLSDFKSLLLEHMPADFIPKWSDPKETRPWRTIDFSKRRTGMWGFMQSDRMSYLGLGVTDIEWLPDGEEVFSAGEDGNVRVWRVADGAAKQVYAVSSQPVFDILLRPENAWFAAGTVGLGSIWNMNTRQKHADLEYSIINSSRDVAITHLELSSDSRHIVGLTEYYYGQSSLLYSWSVPDGRFTTRLDTPEHDKVNSYAFAAETTMTLSAIGRPPRENPLVLGTGLPPEYDALGTYIASDRQYSVKYRGHRSAVLAVKILESKGKLVTGDFQGQIRVWTMGKFNFDGIHLSSLMEGGSMRDADWSPSRNLAAITYMNGLTYLVHPRSSNEGLPTRSVLPRYQIRVDRVLPFEGGKQNPLAVDDIILEVDGKPVHAFEALTAGLAASDGKTARLKILRGKTELNVEVEKGPWQNVNGVHSAGISHATATEMANGDDVISALRFSLDGQHVYTGAMSGAIVKREAETAGSSEKMVSLDAAIRSIDVDRGSGLFFALADNGKAALWWDDARESLRKETFDAATFGRVLIAPGGKHVALLGQGVMKIYGVEDGKVIATLSATEGAGADGGFTPDGRYFYAVSALDEPEMKGVATRIDLSNRRTQTIDIDYWRYRSLVAIDDHRFAVADRDFTIHVVDFDARKILQKFDYFNEQPQLEISPDGSRIIAYSETRLRVYQIASSTLLLDHEFVAEGASNTKLRLFAEQGRMLRTSEGRAVLYTLPVDTAHLIEAACNVLPESYRQVPESEFAPAHRICTTAR